MDAASADPAHDIIVFDGECVFCSGNAQLVMRLDRNDRFRFAAMQQDVGRELLLKSGIDPDDPETMIVISDGKILRDSDAVIHVYRHLGWPWRMLGAFRLLPRLLRDRGYRLVARNRYRWFGRRVTCWVPQPADRSRLLK